MAGKLRTQASPVTCDVATAGSCSYIYNHREIFRRNDMLTEHSEITDSNPPPGLDELESAKLLYVDNEVFGSTRKGQSSKDRKRAQRILAAEGFPVHEIQDDQRVVTVIGFELNGIKLRARVAIPLNNKALCYVSKRRSISLKERPFASA